MLARATLGSLISMLPLATDVRFAAASQHGEGQRAMAECARVARDLRRLGYAVRDSSGVRGDLVLVLGDVHDPAITGATLGGIDSLRTVFRYDAVGLENHDHDFGNLTASGLPGGRLKAEYESLLARAGPGLVEWAKVASLRRGPSVGPQVARFLEGHRGIAFGLERGDSSMLFLKAAFIYGELLNDAMRAARDSAAALDPRSGWEALRHRSIDTLGAFLAAADPECPRLPERLAVRSAGPAEIGNVLSRLSPWFSRHVLDDRNKAFAANVCRELSRRRGRRAVVVVGLAHTIRGTGWPSLQERLQEAGVVVIVADPPAVRTWLESHPGVIAPAP